jgi:hypothetical protein
MKKSVSNALAGGLISGATVMGVDGLVQSAEAAPVTTEQTRDFSFDFGNNEATCCLDAITGSNQFVFDGFDPSLGKLNTAGLDLVLSGLAPDTANTCCYDFSDVASFSGTLAGLALTSDMVRDLADGVLSVELDINSIGETLNTATLDFTILFNPDTVFTSGPTIGTATLSYTFEPSEVPAPASGALLLGGLMALWTAGRPRRTRGDS